MENNCMTIGFSKCVSIINFFSHFMCRHIAGQIDPRPWTEKTGRSFDHFPQQTSGNYCGILILIVSILLSCDKQHFELLGIIERFIFLQYALCICTNTPFIFTENDVPLIRQWWCILLMERFQIEGHGQRFAFWTDKASRLLQGTLQPLFRVSRSITSDIPPHVQTMVNRTAQEKKLVDFAVQDHGVRQHLLCFWHFAFCLLTSVEKSLRSGSAESRRDHLYGCQCTWTRRKNRTPYFSIFRMS
ncbi:hypothetical protein AMEX_G9711 [Astyanax mexicanus]|uniref:Uncharacterized protein n=1 Tax=Astyanax mexicanus TaxID=7994 RepID=A0A8T2M0M5_ASTMX|nr:hypothetical protein AMEX_G9711 [Astyanax mexicanus]